ncbi:hypothetical protein TNCV_4365081 [Trichonephila clavipes]|nr:hypothetical protein TNCV_4365081 [Trichonephila clavipes]
MESFPNECYCHQEGRSWPTESFNICTGPLLGLMLRSEYRWTPAPQLSRDLSSVSGRRISRSTPRTSKGSNVPLLETISFVATDTYCHPYKEYGSSL